MAVGTDPETSARMRRVRRKDTGPEKALRSVLHRRGLRFRVDQSVDGSRRRADIVFRRARLVVFVDGCFWHRCPDHATQPKSNADFWRMKLAQNVARDRDTDIKLRSAGWEVVRVWEHEDAGVAADRVER